MTRAPRAGQPVRGSRTGRPIMALLDLLGRRWALRVVWELRQGRLTFRALQDACSGVSPTVLNQRLQQLRETGLVDLVESEGYGLTPLGEQLHRVIKPVCDWSEQWAAATSGSRAATGGQEKHPWASRGADRRPRT